MFLWRHRLDNLCLTYVLFPLISPVSIYSGFKKKLSPKEMFSILANNNIFFDHISHSYQGEVAQNEITYASRTTIPFQKSAACIQYSICSNNASLLSGFKMHILQIIVLFRRELPTSKGVIPKVCSVVLDEYHIMYLEKWCTILKDILYMLTSTMWFSFKKMWKGHCMRKRVQFRHRRPHVLLQWHPLPFEKTCKCWREHSFQIDASFLSRESSKVFEHVLTEVFDSTMSISKSVVQIHWLPVFSRERLSEGFF